MRVISADVNNNEGRNSKSYNFCVGGGRAYETLLSENQRHLQLVRDECGFRYLRFHGLLHDDMAVYHEDHEGNAFYNWQYVDLLYDKMLQIGVRPFVELSFMPSALSSGKNTVFFWRGNITMPKSLDKWEKLIAAFTEHVTQRYGEDEIEKWFFEVWNEPNLDIFFASEKPFEDYMRLYESSARAVRSVSSKYRVGGPATAGCAWITEFISACKQHSLPLDFIATHTYGVDGYVDEFGRNMLKLIPDENSVSKDMREVREKINNSELPELPLYFTEWSSSYSSRDNAHDSYHEAAFVLTRIKDAFAQVDAMSYWTFSDIFEEGGPGPAPFHGGFGLINIKGLKKPAFFAYKYLNMLGNTLLTCSDKRALCACDGTGAEILFWDYTIPEQDAPDQQYFVRDLPSKPAEEVSVHLDGLISGDYMLELFGVGYRMNDVYTLYNELGSPRALTREQEAYLNESCNGSPLIKKLVKINGPFDFQQKMRQNDVFLIKLTRL